MQPNQKKQLLVLGGLLAVLVLVVLVFLIPAYRKQAPPAKPAPSKSQESASAAASATTKVAAAPQEELVPPPRAYMGAEPFTDPQAAARKAAGKAPETPGAAGPVTTRAEVPPKMPARVPPPLTPSARVEQPQVTVVEAPAAPTEPLIWYQQASPLRIEPYMPLAARPLPPPTPALQWTLTGIVIGPKRTAVINDGQTSYIVEQGAVVRKIGGAEVVADEVGPDYVKLRYRNRVVTLRLREGS